MSAVALLLMLAGPAHALSDGRDRLPVVLQASVLGSWVNSKLIPNIYLYRYDSNADPKWIPIRFQIDKRRKVNIIHDIGPATDDDANQAADVCALSYFPPNFCSEWAAGQPGATGIRECPTNYGTPFSSDFLGSTDEVVFMARDLGTEVAPTSDWLDDDPANPGSLSADRFRIMVTDDANGNGTVDPGEKHWIYAYHWSSPPPAGQFATDPAPAWNALDPTACAPCSGSQAPNNAFHVDCGTVWSPGEDSSGTPQPASSTQEGFEVGLPSNWITDDFSIVPNGSAVANADILHAFDYNQFGETPDSWNCRGLPRPLGVKVPGAGQVRFIRGIQGSQSGVATRKYEKAYDTFFEVEIELRVHDIRDLQARQGQNATVLPSGSDDGRVWTESNFVTNTEYDVVNALPAPPTSSPPQAEDWHEFTHDTLGGTVSMLVQDPARGPIISMDPPTHLYMDTSTLPHGEFGIRWGRTSCMQDGEPINDGGCGPTNDPESPDLLFRRLRRSVIPVRAKASNEVELILADTWSAAVRSPIVSGTADRECQGGSCAGGPPAGTLCTPLLAVTGNNDGSVQLDASYGSTSGCTTVNTFGFTRTIGGASEAIVSSAGSSSLLDNMTSFGQTHSYRVFAVASDGRISAKSSAASVTPQDTDPPTPPVIESASGIDNGILLEFAECSDLVGLDPGVFLNVYTSATTGGPYTQANSSPIWTSGPSSFTISGVPNGTTRYVVATMVDPAGNESAYTPEVVVTAGPPP